MFFAEFYNYCNRTGKPVAGVGDRSIIILDGREKRERWHRISREECRRRGFIGYRIFHGPNLLRNAPVCDLQILPEAARHFQENPA